MQNIKKHNLTLSNFMKAAGNICYIRREEKLARIAQSV